MGSPYFVHKQVNRTHVVRSFTGFERILEVVARSMGSSTFTILHSDCGPEKVVFDDLLEAYNQACSSRSRIVVFLEARYEWKGWDLFQRVIVFDFSGKVGQLLTDGWTVKFTDGAIVVSPSKEWISFPYGTAVF